MASVMAELEKRKASHLWVPVHFLTPTSVHRLFHHQIHIPNADGLQALSNEEGP